jgi:hypothetical protein
MACRGVFAETRVAESEVWDVNAGGRLNLGLDACGQLCVILGTPGGPAVAKAIAPSRGGDSRALAGSGSRVPAFAGNCGSTGRSGRP